MHWSSGLTVRSITPFYSLLELAQFYVFLKNTLCARTKIHRGLIMSLPTHSLEILKSHKQIVKYAYEFCTRDSMHYGNGVVAFPGEESLFKRLMSLEGGTLQLTDSQVELLFSWLQRYMNPGYGDKKIFMGSEGELYAIVESLVAEIEQGRKQKRAQYQNEQLAKRKSNSVLARLMNKLRSNSHDMQALRDEADNDLHYKE